MSNEATHIEDSMEGSYAYTYTSSHDVTQPIDNSSNYIRDIGFHNYPRHIGSFAIPKFIWGGVGLKCLTFKIRSRSLRFHNGNYEEKLQQIRDWLVEQTPNGKIPGRWWQDDDDYVYIRFREKQDQEVSVAFVLRWSEHIHR